MLYIRWHTEPGFALEWFDGQGDHPLFSREIRGGALGTVEAVVAHHIDTRRAIRKGANMLAGRARSRLALHRDTGNAHIAVEKSPPRALDWEVQLVDPDAGNAGSRTGKKTALSIEFGHIQKDSSGNFVMDGDGSFKRVGGLYILTGAANALAASPNRRF